MFLKQNRTEYDDRLGAVRTNGDWECWLRFFLTGVTGSSTRSPHSVFVEEVTGLKRNRIYRYSPYLNLFAHGGV